MFRDLLFVLAGLVVILLVLLRGEVWLEHGFHIAIDPAQFSNGQFPSQKDRPLPLAHLRDVDGDGSFELVVASLNRRLAAYHLGLGHHRLGSSNSVSAYAEASLLSATGVRVSSGRRPVAVFAGPLSSNDAHEHIVVITDRGAVLCFNHLLELQWESHAQAHIDEADQPLPFDGATSGTSASASSSSPHVIEATGTIVPAAIHEGDDGIVVVAIRERVRSGEARGAVGSVDFDEEAMRKARSSASESRGIHAESEEGESSSGANGHHSTSDDFSRHRDVPEHASPFSFFAFDGASGRLRWRHGAAEDAQDTGAADDFYHRRFQKSASFKLHVLSGLDEAALDSHFQLASPKIFHQDLLSALPFRWRTEFDTSLRPARFQRRRSSAARDASAPETQDELRAERFDSEAMSQQHHYSAEEEFSAASSNPASSSAFSLLHDSVASAASATFSSVSSSSPSTPSSSDASSTSFSNYSPNVVLLRAASGLEAVHAFTGQVVTRLPLEEDRLFADYNGDGIIDTAHVLSTHNTYTGAPGRCQGTVLSGAPPVAPLASIDICRVHSGLFAQLSNVLIGNRGSNSGSSRSFGLSISQPSSAGWAAGDTTLDAVLPAPVRGATIAFLSSNGLLTAISVPPQQQTATAIVPALWQASLGATWSRANHHHDIVPELRRVRLFTDAPSSQSMSLMALGDEQLVLVGLDGTPIAHVDLVEPPLLPALVADIDNDGAADFIVPGVSGYHVYLTRRSMGASLVPVLLALICLVLASLALDFSSSRKQEGRKRN